MVMQQTAGIFREGGAHLDGDEGVGASTVEDGPEVELGVSLGAEDLRADGLVLTAHHGVNIWSGGGEWGGASDENPGYRGHVCKQLSGFD